MKRDDGRVAIKATATVHKYPPGVSIEDIDSGRVAPLEVVTSEDILYLTPEEAQDLGLEVDDDGTN